MIDHLTMFHKGYQLIFLTFNWFHVLSQMFVGWSLLKNYLRLIHHEQETIPSLLIKDFQGGNYLNCLHK